MIPYDYIMTSEAYSETGLITCLLTCEGGAPQTVKPIPSYQIYAANDDWGKSWMDFGHKYEKLICGKRIAEEVTIVPESWPYTLAWIKKEYMKQIMGCAEDSIINWWEGPRTFFIDSRNVSDEFVDKYVDGLIIGGYKIVKIGVYKDIFQVGVL